MSRQKSPAQAVVTQTMSNAYSIDSCFCIIVQSLCLHTARHVRPLAIDQSTTGSQCVVLEGTVIIETDALQTTKQSKH